MFTCTQLTIIVHNITFFKRKIFKVEKSANHKIYAPLCMGGSKGKVGIHLKYYPENRDTFEMHPGKVMHKLVDKPLIQRCYYSNPQCNVTVIRKVSYTKCYLNIVGECKHSTP